MMMTIERFFKFVQGTYIPTLLDLLRDRGKVMVP